MSELIILVMLMSIGISISAILYAEKAIRKPQARHTYIHHIHD